MKSLFKIALALLLIFLLLPTRTLADDKLRADLILQGLRARNAAPIPVEVRFKWESTRILEGRLEMEFREGNRVLGRYRSGDLALTSGEQKFRMLLPPLITPFSDSQVEVQMKFVTAHDAIDLGPSSLFAPTVNERSLVVAWCGTGGENMPSFGLERNLFLDRLVPQPGGVSGRSLTTSFARLAAEDLPAQPLAYTCFDLVVLTADAFKNTRERQLQALARWTKGGGSVCVFVGGGLHPYHISFLNELAESGPAPTFISDDAGNVVSPRKQILQVHSGLGRSVIVTGNDSDPNAIEWRRAAAFLWKIRAEQLQKITETTQKEPSSSSDPVQAPLISIAEYTAQQSFQASNRVALILNAIDNAVMLTDDQKSKVKATLDDRLAALEKARNAPMPERRDQMSAAARAYQTNIESILTPDQYEKLKNRNQNRLVRPPSQSPGLNNGIASIVPSYGSQPSAVGGELMNELMPKTVRLIPFSALIGMLVLFLLMIGPADYFVLGFLRRRRFTWILFPVTSIGFTIATVLMANHYLGLRDQRRSLIVVDIGKVGTAQRWNRYELTFAARDKQSVTELKDALWSALDVRAMPDVYYNNPPAGFPGVQSQVRIVTLSGRSTAYVNRSYSTPNYHNFGVEAGPVWYEGVLPSHFQTSEAIRQWQPVLSRSFSFEHPPVPLISNWSAVEEAWPDLEKIRAAISKEKSFPGDIYVINSSGAIVADSGTTGIFPAEMVQRLCVGESQGFLSLVSQIAPTGGGNFEDAQAMDSGDSALAIVQRIGDDIIVYRRFFHGN